MPERDGQKATREDVHVFYLIASMFVCVDVDVDVGVDVGVYEAG